jgi:hypothetical protein
VADQMARSASRRVYDGVHVEPTDVSLRQAVEAARASGPWDAYVAVGRRARRSTPPRRSTS